MFDNIKSFFSETNNKKRAPLDTNSKARLDNTTEVFFDTTGFTGPELDQFVPLPVRTGSSRIKVSPGLVTWHPDYQSACLTAMRSRKPILLFQLMGDLDDDLLGASGRLARSVLFSAPEIALFIGASFEPAWQNVRSAPASRVDFGNGNSVTRTLPGNIATYVCTADGEVIDILPGIYDPRTYLLRLQRFKLLTEICATGGWQHVEEYHRGQNTASEKNLTAPLVSSTQWLMPRGEELNEWNLLREETASNESARRKLIHDRLATEGKVAPHEITDWLYKEVLGVGLSDPCLGLKPATDDRDQHEGRHERQPITC